MTEEEQAVLATVRAFVDRSVKPVARELEHTNTYPENLIDQMKALGVFGLAIPHPGERHRCRCRATPWSPPNWPEAGCPWPEPWEDTRS
ncbi:hypothetical protein GCM10029964_016100 [Kibdelosporangium lantanae]